MAKANESSAPGAMTSTTTMPNPTAALPNARRDQSLPCPYRQAELLQQALSPDKMRVGFFLGAGCPTSIRVPRNGNDEPLIPDIKGLTSCVRTAANASTTHKANFDMVLKRIGDGKDHKKTIEHVLTHVRGLMEVIGDSSLDGMNKDGLVALDKFICKQITNVMKVRLPSQETPYHQLATWINSIPRTNSVEVFTSNYDLLMEQALEEHNVPYFDGFSGSDRTFFEVPSMEQDELPPRWARLWKLHGSVNWWRTENGIVQRREHGGEDASQMIHPSHRKIDESRKMPYLAMQDRLRAFLARGQSVLVTCGFSFLDEHLTEAILDGLGGNPTAVCFGLVFGDRAEAAAAIGKVGRRGNLRLLGVDGGVLGTMDRDWHNMRKANPEFHGSAVSIGSLPDRTNAPDDRCKFLLGDFKAFGEFLANQVADGQQNMGSNDAP